MASNRWTPSLLVLQVARFCYAHHECTLFTVVAERVGVPTESEFSPRVAAESQLKKLAARSRHVTFFLGAGASKACGLPTIAELLDLVRVDIRPTYDLPANILFAGTRTLEEGLSQLRRIRSLLRDGTAITGFTLTTADELDAAICSSIVRHLSGDGADIEAYRLLSAWLNGQQYTRPVELFTVNYDLLLERGLEAERVHYFDGFIGALKGRFRADLVDNMADSARSLPPTCVRLWKLHGSTNWQAFKTEDGANEIVRVGQPVTTAAAIYPSDEKYDESRRMPFVVLMDRFRRSLETPESLTIISGYRFGDDHLNEMLFEAAKLYPRSELWVTCFDDIPDHLSREALKYRNIVVHAPKAAIVGGKLYGWKTEPIPGIFEDDHFLLGDFRYLTKALLPFVNDGDDK